MECANVDRRTSQSIRAPEKCNHPGQTAAMTSTLTPPTWVNSMYTKIFSIILLATTSALAKAEIQHHNFTVGTCRAFQSGDLQIQGFSETDNQSRIIAFSASAFKEKILDRYISFCIASLSSGSKLRIDYLNCTGTACVTTPDTTINFYKS